MNDGIPNRRLPTVFDGMIDKIFGPKSRHLVDTNNVKTQPTVPSRSRSLSAGTPFKESSRPTSQNRHAHRNTTDSGKYRVAFPYLKEDVDNDNAAEKPAQKVSFRSSVAFEREDTLSESLPTESSIRASPSAPSLWKGKGIMGTFRGRLKSNKEGHRSRSSSPTLRTGFKAINDKPVDVVEGPFTSQATLRAGTSEDLLKSGGLRTQNSEELGRGMVKMAFVPSPSEPQLPSMQQSYQDEIDPETIYSSNPNIGAQVSVHVEAATGDAQIHEDLKISIELPLPILRPISSAEADQGLVPLAIQPEPLLIPPPIKSRGNSNISFFNSLRRSTVKNQAEPSSGSSIKSKISFFDIDVDGRPYRSATLSSSQKNSAEVCETEGGWRKSFISSSSFVLSQYNRGDSASEEVVVIESPCGASPISPPFPYFLPDTLGYSDDANMSTGSLSRRSTQESAYATSEQNIVSKSTTHLAVSVDGSAVIAGKRSRSVDFGLHRIRSVSTQPAPVTRQPSVKSTNFTSLPRHIATSSASSIRSRRPTQVVETNTIYDKHEQSTKVVSPHGFPEETQGKVNQYLILRDIGRGSFGRVVLCRDVDIGRYYACKVISKSRLKRQFRFSGDHLTTVKKEIAILKKLSKHPNINSLVEVLNDENEDNLYMSELIRSIYLILLLVFELCEYGPVMNIRSDEVVRPFEESLARKYFRDMILGIEYLHSQNVIHRDLKPENLLLTADMVVQIADFGISHMFQEGEDDYLEDKNASPAFSPPEACNSKEKRISGKAVDIWSLGVTLYCMVHGRCPFADDCIMEVYRKIGDEEPVISPHLSPALHDLISGMMKKEPSDRWKLEDVRSCDWITNFGKEPMISTEQNCKYETEVTDQDIENAFSPVVKFLMKIKNILKFRRFKSLNRQPGCADASNDEVRAKSATTSTPPTKGILRKGSWSLSASSPERLDRL
ncbi:hypothetical protein HDU67_006856 [Dinochytrium kinnereticum]|nr:hypothetical protein HDU67_006856 [Dinochytrium kinnereticum]